MSNGISLYDITSNVTIDKSVVKDVTQNGIQLSPSFEGFSVFVPSGIMSTFRYISSLLIVTIIDIYLQ